MKTQNALPTKKQILRHITAAGTTSHHLFTNKKLEKSKSGLTSRQVAAQRAYGIIFLRQCEGGEGTGCVRDEVIPKDSLCYNSFV